RSRRSSDLILTLFRENLFSFFLKLFQSLIYIGISTLNLLDRSLRGFDQLQPMFSLWYSLSRLQLFFKDFSFFIFCKHFILPGIRYCWKITILLEPLYLCFFLC